MSDVQDGYDPVEGEISYRLMDETSSTITEAKLTIIANKIKTEFGTNNGYIWKKGKGLYSYTEKDKGYQFQVLARTKSDAKEIVGKVLQTRSDTPDWKKFNSINNEEELEAYPYTAGTHLVMGKTQKLPRRRPNINVRFQWAEAHFWGTNKCIILYDASGSHFDALVE